MARLKKNLLEQIEEGALDGTTPLAATLRKCVALGGRAGSTELRDWARRELDGYANAPEEEMPAYRTVRARICIDGSDMAKVVEGQQISRWDLPEFARDAILEEAPIPHGVAELESFATTGPVVRMQHPGMQDLVKYMNSHRKPYSGAIHTMYWSIPDSSIVGILDQIRTNLVALVAEMRASGAEDLPTADAANQAVNVVLKGVKRSTITVNANQAGTATGDQALSSSPPATKEPRVPDWIRGPWAVAVGAMGLVGGLATVATWAGWLPFG